MKRMLDLKVNIIMIGLVLSCSSMYAVEGGLSQEDTVWLKSRYGKYQMESKDPGIAYILSWLVPGAGQIYNGSIKSGVVNLCLFVGWWSLITYTGIDKKFEFRGVDKHPYCVLGFVCLLGHMSVASNLAHSFAVERNEALKKRYRIYR